MYRFLAAERSEEEDERRGSNVQWQQCAVERQILMDVQCSIARGRDGESDLPLCDARRLFNQTKKTPLTNDFRVNEEFHPSFKLFNVETPATSTFKFFIYCISPYL